MPAHVGQYELLNLLGDGGMGSVYRGRDPRLDRIVAIKVLHSQLLRDVGVVDRFKTEALIQAKLQHPHVVAALDLIVEPAALAIVMEYVNGPSLEQLLERSGGAMPVWRAQRLAGQVLSAVGYAHDQGVVHRDLKPSNVLVCDAGGEEHAKVTDFGIAKVLGTAKGKTATGATLGTLGYMSPEQVRSPKHVDRRSDIYSIGVLLYELLTGGLPYEADSEYEVMRRIAEAPAIDFGRVARVAAPATVSVIERALAKDPACRFQSCGDMRTALLADSAVHGASRPTAVTFAPAIPQAGVRASTARAATTAAPAQTTTAATTAASATDTRSWAPLFVASLVVLLLAFTSVRWLSRQTRQPESFSSQADAQTAPAIAPALDASPAVWAEEVGRDGGHGNGRLVALSMIRYPVDTKQVLIDEIGPMMLVLQPRDEAGESPLWIASQLVPTRASAVMARHVFGITGEWGGSLDWQGKLTPSGPTAVVVSSGGGAHTFYGSELVYYRGGFVKQGFGAPTIFEDVDRDGRIEAVVADTTLAYFHGLCYACSPGFKFYACFDGSRFQDCTTRFIEEVRKEVPSELPPDNADDRQKSAALAMYAGSLLIGETDEDAWRRVAEAADPAVLAWMEEARAEIQTWARTRAERLLTDAK